MANSFAAGVTIFLPKSFTTEHLETGCEVYASELLRNLEDEFARVKEILDAERQRRTA